MDFDKTLKKADKVLGYNRVSTEQQKVKGAVKGQVALLQKRLDDRKVAKRKIKMYIEEGVSAQLPRENRPVYNKMLHDAVRYALKGKKVVIVVTELDRFTRNQFQAGRDFAELLIPNGIQLLTFKEQIVTGTNTILEIQGNLVFGIMSALATAEGGKARVRGKESREKLEITGFSDAGAKLGLYSESKVGNLYRKALEIEPMMLNDELTPTGASKHISRLAGKKENGAAVITEKVFFRALQKDLRESPFIRMKKVQTEETAMFFQNWLALIDRLIEFEKIYGNGSPQMLALRYQTSGAVGRNKNAPQAEFWTIEKMQEVVDKPRDYLSPSALVNLKKKKVKI